MTHPTNEELDEMARELCHTGELSMLYRCEISDAITALRAQLAEARTELVRRVDMHECAMAERDDATLYSDEQKARADRAEAALAAQIEADAGIADDYTPEKHGGMTLQAHVTGRNIATAIRNQPHDRTALDRMLAEAEAKALRRAADMAMQKTYRTHAPKDFRDGYDVAKADAATAILNMIPKEGEA